MLGSAVDFRFFHDLANYSMHVNTKHLKSEINRDCHAEKTQFAYKIELWNKIVHSGLVVFRTHAHTLTFFASSCALMRSSPQSEFELDISLMNPELSLRFG